MDRIVKGARRARGFSRTDGLSRKDVPAFARGQVANNDTSTAAICAVG